jgi:hypothetical protein
MKRIPCRVIIYTRDIENIMGRHKRTAFRVMQKIRKQNNKRNGDVVTIKEFCTYMKMDEQMVRPFLE